MQDFFHQQYKHMHKHRYIYIYVYIYIGRPEPQTHSRVTHMFLLNILYATGGFPLRETNHETDWCGAQTPSLWTSPLSWSFDLQNPYQKGLTSSKKLYGLVYPGRNYLLMLSTTYFVFISTWIYHDLFDPSKGSYSLLEPTIFDALVAISYDKIWLVWGWKNLEFF